MSQRPSISDWARWAWKDWKTGWAAILMLASAIAFVVIAAHEPAVRVWGMVLQLVGIAAVVDELRNTTRHYGRRGIRDAIRHAWENRPGTPRVVNLVGMSIEANSGVMFGVASVTARSGASLEDRVALLEQQARDLAAGIAKTQSELAAEKAERGEADRVEAQQRREAIEGLDRRIEDVIAGSVPVSMLGVWVLALGVVLTSVAPELVELTR